MTNDSGPIIKPEYKIQNVVATATFDVEGKIDLVEVVRKNDECEYNPERFPGLIMRVENPRGTILLFSTGKMVITGMRKEAEAEPVVQKVMKRLKRPIVMEHAMYEPEVFPGLIYRTQEPKAVFLIFSAGSIVCTGVRRAELVEDAVNKLSEQVAELGIAGNDGEFHGNQNYGFL